MTGNGDKPFGTVLYDTQESETLAKDLTGFDHNVEVEDIKISTRNTNISLTYFENAEESNAFARLLARAIRCNRMYDLLELKLIAESRPSIGGRAREQVLQAIASLYWTQDSAEATKEKTKMRKPNSAQFV